MLHLNLFKTLGWISVRKENNDLLSSMGIRISENRVGKALQRVNPQHHISRRHEMHRLLNPKPYEAYYFGQKIHIDQNEKLCLFGVTHVLAIDGYSKRIISLCSMPVKNPVTIYHSFFR